MWQFTGKQEERTSPYIYMFSFSHFGNFMNLFKILPTRVADIHQIPAIDNSTFLWMGLYIVFPHHNQWTSWIDILPPFTKQTLLKPQKSDVLNKELDLKDWECQGDAANSRKCFIILEIFCNAILWKQSWAPKITHEHGEKQLNPFCFWMPCCHTTFIICHYK